MSKRGSPIGRRPGLQWKYGQDLETLAEESSAAPNEVKVGDNLRRIREAGNLSLRALAEISGLAINTLSLIENGKSSPSVSTLQQLAGALDIPISAFFETTSPRKNIAHIKSRQRSHAIFEHGSLEDLGAGSVIQAVEPFVITSIPRQTAAVWRLCIPVTNSFTVWKARFNTPSVRKNTCWSLETACCSKRTCRTAGRTWRLSPLRLSWCSVLRTGTSALSGVMCK